MTPRPPRPHALARGIVPALALLASLVPPALAATAEHAAPTVAVRAVGTIGLTVADLDRALDFYQRVLGFTRIAAAEVADERPQHLTGVPPRRARVAGLRLGDESISLTECASPRGRPARDDARANDRDFQHVAIIVRDMARAYAWLRDNGVRPASTGGPQRLPAWNAAAAGIEAFYFRDPDGHFLEVLAFPPDKGADKWHRPGDELFLGIDHTAIVVGDTDASLRLYRDRLGMAVTGESENFGTEQEHLNGVPGAHLRITTLRAPAGPGIELLEYLAPRSGRPAPDDVHVCDVGHWQTRLVVDDAARLGAHAAVLVRDPDGHALELAGDASSPHDEENTR